jgi:hypothetical protein
MKVIRATGYGLIAEKYPETRQLMLFDISAMLQDGGAVYSRLPVNL